MGMAKLTNANRAIVSIIIFGLLTLKRRAQFLYILQRTLYSLQKIFMTADTCYTILILTNSDNMTVNNIFGRMYNAIWKKITS